jgi:hypothetical protein
LDRLPATLRAYGRALNPAAERVLVLVDLDADRCMDLKGRMTALLDLCDPAPAVLFRIAIEETEAFYLGDPAAIRRAFPQARLNKMRDYVQDNVCGTWELFRDVIGAQSEDKVEWAARMGEQLGTDWRGTQANRSPSFRQFCIALRKLAGEPVD